MHVLKFQVLQLFIFRSTLVFTFFQVALLDSLFPDGVAYCLGAVNRDCWYLYTLNPLPQRHPQIPGLSTTDADQTLEILMTDLDPDVMAIFTKVECLNGTEATKVRYYF